MSVTVITVAYHSKAKLEGGWAEALLTELDVVDQISLVYNGEQERAELPPALDDLTRIIQLDHNRFFTHGINQSLRTVRGGDDDSDWVLLLNPDVYPMREGWLRDAIAEASRLPQCGAAGFVLCHNGHIDHAGGLIGPDGRPGDHIARNHPISEAPATQEVAWCTGAALLIKGEALDQVPYLSGRHPHFDSDSEYCQALHQADWRVYCLGIPLGHEVNSSTDVAPRDRVSPHHRIYQRPRLIWHGPVTDPSGYAAEGRQLLECIPGNWQPLLRPLMWSQEQLRLEPGQQAWLQELANAGEKELKAVVTHGFPTFFHKQPLPHIGRTMYETDRVPEEWKEGLQNVDHLWLPSQYVLETFSRHHESCFLVPSPIDCRTFRPLEEKFGTPDPEVCRFLFVGEWIKRKGWRELLNAFRGVFGEDDRVELVLKTYSSMGQSKEAIAEEIRGWCDWSGLKVSLLSTRLTDQEMAWLYNSAHALVHPSHGEGFGRPVAEALACGIEAISGGETGLLDVQPDPLAMIEEEVPEEAFDQMIQAKGGDHCWYSFEEGVFEDALHKSYLRWAKGEPWPSRRQFIIDRFSPPAVTAMMAQALDALGIA